MTQKYRILGIALATFIAVPSAFAATDTATTDLAVTVAPEASIAVTASPTLTKGGTKFESYTGNTTFTFKVRTTASGGSGSVTALVTTPFASASNITTGDLSHIAATAGAGTANTSSTTASETVATNIITFGQDAHSADVGDSATINWTLADRPQYVTGSYSATVTLTISAL